MLYQEEGAEEELEIELNEDEPAFLQGQSRYSMDMSPVKIFKNLKVLWVELLHFSLHL